MSIRLKFLSKILFLILLLSTGNQSVAQDQDPYILVLGTAQDGGYPHLGCERNCCDSAWAIDSLQSLVVSIAVVNPKEKKWYLFEATPDFHEQLHLFRSLTNEQYDYLPNGIFLTHAHMGHYTGLMELGREALNSKSVPVHVLPKFKNYLETNGPWSQLVELKNIEIHAMKEDSMGMYDSTIGVKAYRVPHRDEFSETAGFTIHTGKKKYLFIPDIDKWSKFDKSIVEEVKKVDVAMLDATFYSQFELPFRNIKMIPHPLVTETMELFKKEAVEIKKKVLFIHFNHTNPLLRNNVLKEKVRKEGYGVAEDYMRL